MSKLILSDISRCLGFETESKCDGCARRQQIALDNPNKWFPYMPPAIMAGACQFFIKVEK